MLRGDLYRFPLPDRVSDLNLCPATSTPLAGMHPSLAGAALFVLPLYPAVTSRCVNALIRSFTGPSIRSAFTYATECLTFFSGRAIAISHNLGHNASHA